MTDEMVTRSRMPQPGMRHRRAVVPGAPFNYETSGLRAQLQALSDLLGRLVRGYFVLGVRPCDMGEEPTAGPLSFEGAAVDARRRFGIDDALLELKRLVVTKVQATYPQDRGARGHPQQLAALRIVLELAALQQSILVGTTTARDDVRDIPDLEDGTLQSGLGNDCADTPSPLNQALSGQALYCAPDRHARCMEAPRQYGLGRNSCARRPHASCDWVRKRAPYLLPDGPLAVERWHDCAAGRPPRRSSGRRACYIRRRIASQVFLLGPTRSTLYSLT